MTIEKLSKIEILLIDQDKALECHQDLQVFIVIKVMKWKEKRRKVLVKE